MGRKILVVDDERNIVDIVAFNLHKEGYDVATAFDGETGLKKALETAPDLVLLDIMMPKMDGFEVCRRIREKSQVPIIMLTARVEEVDKVLGLELGADDYVTKPFSVRELLARVKANLRRQDFPEKPDTEEGVLEFEGLTVDGNRYEVRKAGVPVELTHREFELIQFLAVANAQVFSREALLEKVWGYEYFGDARTVDVTVRRLRSKVEDDAEKPKYILTKRSVGYYFGGKPLV